MTSPVATIGLTYASTELQDSNLGIFLEITVGLNEPPEARGTDYVIPSLDGQVARPHRPDHLDIILKGWVRGVGSDDDAQIADFRLKADTLRALFAPSRAMAALVATAEDGSVRTIQARPVGVPNWDEILRSLFANVSVRLISFDPDWEVAGS